MERKGDGMSVLIKGMEMPKHGDVLVVREYNGKTYIKHEGHLGFEGILSKIPIPHGRLIDADAPLEKVSKMMQEPDYQHEGENWMVGLIMARDAIDEADTIIKAERNEE